MEVLHQDLPAPTEAGRQPSFFILRCWSQRKQEAWTIQVSAQEKLQERRQKEEEEQGVEHLRVQVAEAGPPQHQQHLQVHEHHEPLC